MTACRSGGSTFNQVNSHYLRAAVLRWLTVRPNGAVPGACEMPESQSRVKPNVDLEPEIQRHNPGSGTSAYG